MQNFPCCILTRSPYFQVGRLIANTSINLRYSSRFQVPIIVRPHTQILSLCQGRSFLESGNNIRLSAVAHKLLINARPFSTKKINKFKVKAKGSTGGATLGGNTTLKMQHKAKVISAKCISVTGKLNDTAPCSNPDTSTTGSAQGDDNKNSEGSVINRASKNTKCGQAAASKTSVKKKHKSKSMDQDDIVANKETSKSNSSAHKTKLPVKKNQNPASKKKVKELSKSSTVLEIPADTSNLTKVNDVHSSSESTKNMIFKPLYPPSGKSVVVVESVTKAKVIQNYLGNMYEVLPSNGHLRDLAGKSGSVRPDDDFSMVWEVRARSLTHLKSIKDALKGAENLILASDPDREGEAIAWHIIDMLQQQDALSKHITVARVVFHEITESSIKSALQTPREIDRNLVDAYLARRALII